MTILQEFRKLALDQWDALPADQKRKTHVELFIERETERRIKDVQSILMSRAGRVTSARKRQSNRENALKRWAKNKPEVS